MRMLMMELHPNENIPVNTTIENIPGAQSFINTSTNLTPKVEMQKEEPQIIIPSGQNISPNLMEGFKDTVIAEE